MTKLHHERKRKDPAFGELLLDIRHCAGHLTYTIHHYEHLLTQVTKQSASKCEA